MKAIEKRKEGKEIRHKTVELNAISPQSQNHPHNTKDTENRT